MPSIKILVVDDDPDIRDVIRITLEDEKYEVTEAGNGEEALKAIETKVPDLVLVDYKMPRMDGREFCRRIKKDILLRHLPIIMVTGKGELTDKVDGIEAGADDYIVKPFEPKELIAHIRMILRRSGIDLEANPLTRLPGNVSILDELNRRLGSKDAFAVCYVDLNKFKAYNDTYGFQHGDRVIKETARILLKTVQEHGNPEDFVGHIGGDDYVVITTIAKMDVLCTTIIATFDAVSPTFYNETDRANGYIVAHDRQGQERKFPLLSVGIGVVTNQHIKIDHVAQIGEIGAELKSYAKSLPGSNYVVDKRKEP
ncbi:MAG TPA: response regulator [Candidatus Omnitrophota bacterium]|nr:response regulator [Candidatus Omnitrophota bacterium]